MNKQRNGRKNVKREQPRKDNKTKRVNFDNERMSKFEKDMDKFKDPGTTDKSNDVRWYANNPELLRSAASLPFSQTTGLQLPYRNGLAVPGILSLNWAPVIGGPGYSPINQAKDSVYSYTVHANSRNQSYDGADEMMLILAGAQLFAFLALGIRAYGTMKTFDQTNRYLPEGLIQAMGFDYSDLQSNLSRMWFDINELIARSAQIWIPNTMPVIERWFWMNSNIYMDSSSVKGQYYLFTPRVVYTLSETGSQLGTSLTPTTWNVGANSGAGNTWANYMSIINGMFTALLDSQDRGIIFGDILKAYGQDKIYSVNEIPSNYQVVPVYDTEVLTQIENSVSFNNRPLAITQTETGTIEQNWNPLTVEAIKANVNVGIPRSVLNFHQKELPTPEQIMVATRLTALSTNLVVQGNSAKSYGPGYAGTEVVMHYNMWNYNWNSGQPTLARTTVQSAIDYANTSSTVLTQWTAFDWAPWLYFIDTGLIGNAIPPTSGSFAPIPNYAMGDFDNYTIVDYNTISKMHLTAVYSEFGVPTI